MRALARGVLAALVVAGGAARRGGRARDDRAHDAGATVRSWPTQPREVQLRWSEPVDLGPDSVRLLDASGGTLDTPKAAHIRR